MALTSDNIQTIKQFADKLEKWANNLSYSTSQTKNFWVELILFFYPQDLQVTVSWLANIPTIGQKVQKDFEELSKMIHKVDIWHIQGVWQEEFGEFGALIDRLKKVALNIVFTLRKISDTDRLDLPVTEVITLEKSNTSELLETTPARMELERVPAKTPRKEALMAYNLHYEMGLTQSQVAKRMTAELKLGKPVRQWEVSRWIKQVENWRIRTGFPVDSVPEKGKNPSPLVLNDRPD
jgi:hypothetical protein